MKKLVSVIIPVYNVAAYLEQCITSITQQTYKNLEIICINDGSTDNSLAILNNLKSLDNRIIVIDKKNEGVSVARNCGINEANGEYIIFCDSDDWLEKNCVADLIKKLQDDPCDILCFGAFDVIENEKKIHWDFSFIEQYVTRNNLTNNELKHFIHNIWGKCYRTEFLKRNNIYFPKGIKTAEDGIFNLLCLYKKPLVSFIDKTYYNYRIARQDSAIHSGETAINTDIDAFKYIINSAGFHDADDNTKIITLEKFIGGFYYYFSNYENAKHRMKYAFQLNKFKKYLFKTVDKALLKKCSNIKDFKKYSIMKVLLNRLFSVKKEFIYNYKYTNLSLFNIDFCLKKELCIKGIYCDKVSIIIPIYNVEKYIKECLNSVLKQTYKNIEIICIDDCGTDKSLKIVEEFAQNDPRIKVVKHDQNKGLGEARNTGMSYATGKYIFFLDSDDFLEINIIEKMVNKIEETKADVVFAQNKAFTLEKDKKTLKRVDSLNEWLKITDQVDNHQIYVDNFQRAIDSYPCVAWGKLYNAKFLNENNILFIHKNAIHEDNGFFLKLCSQFPNISIINDLCVNYRIRKNALTTNTEEISNWKFKKKNMKACVYDAIRYIKSSQNKEFSESLILQILNSYTYQDYFIIKNKIYNFRWFLNDKRIALFGLTIYREKISKNKLKKELLGIPFYKGKVREIEYDPKKFRTNGSSKKQAFKTNTIDEKIAEQLRMIQDFIFLPNRGNLGDVVISFSEMQYFESNKFKYKVMDVEQLKQTDCKNLVYGGGGIWCNQYKNDYDEIVELFKKKNIDKIIILPSSFNNCDDVIKVFDERFTVFCREKQSYDYCLSLNKKATFILADDMVLGANFEIYSKIKYKKIPCKQINIKKVLGLYTYYRKSKLKFYRELKFINDFSVGYLLRTDNEKKIEYYTKTSIDPSLYLGGSACDFGNNFILTLLFLSAIDLFDTIVTDRLHIGICAAKLGKNVILLDNSYGKLSSVYNYSLKKYTNVTLAKEQELDAIIDKIKQSEFIPIKQDYICKLPSSFVQFCKLYSQFKINYNGEEILWL